MKWPIYFAAMSLWLVGVYFCWRLNRIGWQPGSKISVTLAVGCILSSIALPHLLYYDLCLLIPTGFMLANANTIVPHTLGTKAVARVAWACVSIYLPVFLILKPHVALALTLEIALLIAWIYLLSQISQATKAANAV
jgi:hypothetical protein